MGLKLNLNFLGRSVKNMQKFEYAKRQNWERKYNLQNTPTSQFPLV